MTAMTDPRALAAHRSRADPAGMFLHRHVADEIEDRLSLVNKTFTAPAIVTGFPQEWRDFRPDTRIVPEAEVLALSPDSHDLIIHALSLHWASDPVGQLIQCRRALRPDGLLIVACFGGETLHELRRCLGQAEIALKAGLSPRVAPMAELRDLGALMQRAGLALPVADLVPLNASYRDIWHLMTDLRRMGETNALAGRLRSFTPRGLFDAAGELYRTHFATEDKRIAATFELVFLTGWAPADSQPRPLRPGSAKARLADALRTSETPLPD